MQAYRMESSVQDREFLSGVPVVCRAVMKDSAQKVRPGDFILIELSTGKKYKGKVVEFRSFAIDTYVAGDLVIIRA
jgi:hypothetical protein